MPLIQVALQQGTSSEYRHALAAGIQQAMIDVLGIPQDDYFQVTHEHTKDNLIYDRNFFGVPRSENAVIVSLSFNARPAAAKQALFAAIAENLERDTGLSRADLFITIVETAPENWWAHGRSVDEISGTDSRMRKQPGA